jgi:queuine tRNA-ribosyltransferase
VRTTLLLAGWFVGRGSATGEKEQTTIAASELQLLEKPLDDRWLERVARSTRPGPLGIAVLSPAELMARLRRHPQFNAM